MLLVSPQVKEFLHSFRLEFYYTNNIVEYEALIFNLDMVRKMGIKQLKIFRDSDLGVSQVREAYK